MRLTLPDTPRDPIKLDTSTAKKTFQGGHESVVI